ncbi:MAG: MBL fold metallo-hydrolase [Egibacteraceae bacterium]
MPALTLTVFGCSGTHIGPTRSCSSYLVQYEDYRLLLDCGNGSLANLQRRIDIDDIDAVLLSHMHADHFADLFSLYYARRLRPDGPLPLDVYGPAGAQAFIAQLLPDDDIFPTVCHFHVAAAGDTLQLGPLSIQLFASNHPIETLASRIEVDGKVLAYSGDSAPTPAMVDCARDADLFVCDATWLERHRPHPDGVHMTGAEAGAHAAEAGCTVLLLSHIFPSNDPAEVAAEAAGSFDGTVMVAEDLQDHVL